MSIREYQNQIEGEEEYKKIKIAQEKIKLEILKLELKEKQEENNYYNDLDKQYETII